jgi:hypothetical protein
MPNHVTNILTFANADEKKIAEIKEFLKNGDRELDFNNIAPIPKELEGTRSPVHIISQKEYDKQEERIAKGDISEAEKNWGLSRGLTQEVADEYKTRFGHADWYNWQLSNWGTKWNAYEVYVGDDYIEFQTAWATPFEIFVKLSKIFPDVLFNIRYSDEDFGYNVGEFELLNGDEVNENVPEGGSEEAYLMAIDIQYGGNVIDYLDCNEDVFTDDYTDDDDEELSDYVATIVNIAYNHEFYPTEDCGYHKLVLERFKELALEDENFELVIVIDKELNKVEN